MSEWTPASDGMRVLGAWHARDSGHRVIEIRLSMGSVWSVRVYSKRSPASMRRPIWHTEYALVDAANKAIADYESRLGKRKGADQ